MTEKTLKTLKTPFNLYDFFGYLIPSAIFCAGVILYLTAISLPLSNILKLNEIITIQNAQPLSQNPWPLLIYGGFIALCILYALGHVIATLSSIFLDKLLVEGCIGYPFERLLGTRKAKNPLRILKRLAFQSAFSSTFILWFIGLYHPVVYYSTTFGAIILFYIWLAVIILSGLAHSVAWSWERRIDRDMLNSYQKILLTYKIFSSKKSIRFYIYLLRFIGIPFLFLIEAPLWLTRAKRTFDRRFQENLKIKFLEDFNVSIESSETNAFWLPYIYVVKSSPEDGVVLRQFLNLYGFARNLSMAFLLLSLIGYFIRFYGYNSPEVFKFTCIFAIFSALFGVRYYYLYYGYFSKYIYRAYSLLPRREMKSDVISSLE